MVLVLRYLDFFITDLCCLFFLQMPLVCHCFYLLNCTVIVFIFMSKEMVLSVTDMIGRIKDWVTCLPNTSKLFSYL